MASVLHIVGAGDSPVVLIRPDTYQLFVSRTSGFSPAGPMRAIGISKQLGTLYRAEVALAPGDRVVLATDGIADLVPRPELVEVVRAAASPEVAVEQLHRLLVSRHAAAPLGSQGRRDDWTTIVRFSAVNQRVPGECNRMRTLAPPPAPAGRVRHPKC